MQLAIMQPYFFPYLGYFQLVNAVDKFIIYDDVNYINRGWVNRNKILINGESNLVSVPLINASQNKLINALYIVKDDAWKTKLDKSIQFAYKKAPCFNEVYPFLRECIFNNQKMIHHYNAHILKLICYYLNIKTNFLFSSELYNNNTLKSQDRILDICINQNAISYINLIGGKELYDKTNFELNNIKLSFMKMDIINYKQFNNNFVQSLSIIDILMFNEIQEVSDLLNCYKLL